MVSLENTACAAKNKASYICLNPIISLTIGMPGGKKANIFLGPKAKNGLDLNRVIIWQKAISSTEILHYTAN